MDQPEFWQAPGRLAKIQANRRDFLQAPGETQAEAAAVIGGLRSVQFPLGDPEDDRTPIANLVEFPPMFPLPRHTHDCDVAMFVLKGTMYADGRVLHPGDGMTAKAHEFYGPEVAGPDGCTRIEFFGSMSGLLGVIYEKLDGEVFTTHGLQSTGVVNPRELMGIDELRALMRSARADGASA
jgi:hypothetical protein